MQKQNTENIPIILLEKTEVFHAFIPSRKWQGLGQRKAWVTKIEW